MRREQQWVDAWIRKYGGYWTPKRVIRQIFEETRELRQEARDHLRPRRGGRRALPKTVKIEAGDLLFALICFANPLGIDLGEALRETIAKYTRRDGSRYARKRP